MKTRDASNFTFSFKAFKAAASSFFRCKNCLSAETHPIAAQFKARPFSLNIISFGPQLVYLNYLHRQVPLSSFSVFSVALLFHLLSRS